MTDSTDADLAGRIAGIVGIAAIADRAAITAEEHRHDD